MKNDNEESKTSDSVKTKCYEKIPAEPGFIGN
jgi:hypothetical protein